MTWKGKTIDPQAIERAIRARFSDEFDLRARTVFLAEREGTPDEPHHMTRTDIQRLCIVSEIIQMYRSIGMELGLHGLSYFGMDRPDGRREYFIAMPGRRRVYLWTAPRPGHPEDLPDRERLIQRAVETIREACEASIVPDLAEAARREPDPD